MSHRNEEGFVVCVCVCVCVCLCVCVCVCVCVFLSNFNIFFKYENMWINDHIFNRSPASGSSLIFTLHLIPRHPSSVHRHQHFQMTFSLKP